MSEQVQRNFELYFYISLFELCFYIHLGGEPIEWRGHLRRRPTLPRYSKLTSHVVPLDVGRWGAHVAVRAPPNAAITGASIAWRNSDRPFRIRHRPRRCGEHHEEELRHALADQGERLTSNTSTTSITGLTVKFEIYSTAPPCCTCIHSRHSLYCVLDWTVRPSSKTCRKTKPGKIIAEKYCKLFSLWKMSRILTQTVGVMIRKLYKNE